MIGLLEIVFASGIAGIIALVAIIDILRHEFNGNNKLIWVLVVLMLPLVGSILYFFIGRNQKIPSK
jgi:hypothetical protein